MPLILLNNWKLILAACVIAFAYYMGGVRVQDKWDLDTAERERATAETIAKSLTDNATLTTTLEIQKNEAQARIDTLARDNAALRVRLPKPTVCSTATPSGSVQPAPVGELLPTTPEDPQAALDRFMAESDDDARSADIEIASCRVVKEWAKAQAPKK